MAVPPGDRRLLDRGAVCGRAGTVDSVVAGGSGDGRGRLFPALVRTPGMDRGADAGAFLHCPGGDVAGKRRRGASLCLFHCPHLFCRGFLGGPAPHVCGGRSGSRKTHRPGGSGGWGGFATAPRQGLAHGPGEPRHWPNGAAGGAREGPRHVTWGAARSRCGGPGAAARGGDAAAPARGTGRFRFPAPCLFPGNRRRGLRPGPRAATEYGSGRRKHFCRLAFQPAFAAFRPYQGKHRRQGGRERRGEPGRRHRLGLVDRGTRRNSGGRYRRHARFRPGPSVGHFRPPYGAGDGNPVLRLPRPSGPDSHPSASLSHQEMGGAGGPDGGVCLSSHYRGHHPHPARLHHDRAGAGGRAR